ncbi:MAG: autotransporter domain-containing protein [Candidatus Paracaedibacteraceae bacterium]|nr:autotransporter domain-containing protein [Candidatus Paracaedibacteraceae bacterium]
MGTLNGRTYAGIISGNGGITKQGTGKLTLTGPTPYTGPTTVTEGTLAIGAGGSLAQSSTVNLSTPGAVVDLSSAGSQTLKDLTGVSGTSLILGTNASDILTLGTANSRTFGGTITGNGGLLKQGTGLLTLTGTNTYTGPTSINGGELKVNGSIANSAVTVTHGTRISGIGTVGPLTTLGTIAPGNSIGKLIVNGNYTQPGTYECEVDSYGNTDQIEINGSANLSGGTLKVMPLAGNHPNGFSQSYTILTAIGGLGNTTFATVNGTSPLFTYQAAYGTYDASITITKTLSVNQAIPLGNPGRVAEYINVYGPPTLTNTLNTLDRNQLTKAFNDISPAANTQVSDMISNAELSAMDKSFMRSNTDRLIKNFAQLQAQLMLNLMSFKQSFTQLFASKLHHKTTAFVIDQDRNFKYFPFSTRSVLEKATVWMHGSAGRFGQDNIADPSGLAVQGVKGNAYHTNVGLDYAFSPNFTGGITTGYGSHQYKMKVNGDKGSTNSVRIGVYGLGEMSPAWYIKGAIYYGHHRFKGNRIMTVIPAVAHQKHRGNHLSGLIELGHDIRLSQSWAITPYMSGEALSLWEKRYTERGANIQNLRVRDRHSTTVQGKTGIQGSKSWNRDDCRVGYSFARLGLTYRRVLHKNQKVYAALIDQGGQFTVLSKNKHHVLANPSAGITALIKRDLSLALTSEGEIGATQRNHQAMIRLSWKG